MSRFQPLKLLARVLIPTTLITESTIIVMGNSFIGKKTSCTYRHPYVLCRVYTDVVDILTILTSVTSYNPVGRPRYKSGCGQEPQTHNASQARGLGLKETTKITCSKLHNTQSVYSCEVQKYLFYFRHLRL